MSAKVFLDERGIQITDQMLVSKNQTYPIRGITSVRFREVEPGFFKIAFFLVPGMLIIGWTCLSIYYHGIEEPEALGTLLAIGLLFLFPGLYFLGARKGVYSVLISGAGMFPEKEILTDSNKFFVKKVYRALNQAVQKNQEGTSV